MYGHCERARQWASADVDGELSTFERVLLADHVARCHSCREFHMSVSGLTGAIRSAPHERFEGLVIGRIRRQVRLRLSPAVAAMAVAAVGLGSILVASQVRTGSVPGVQSARESAADAGTDTMNLRTSRALERLSVRKPVRAPRSVHRSLRGGPVIREP